MYDWEAWAFKCVRLLTASIFSSVTLAHGRCQLATKLKLVRPDPLWFTPPTAGFSGYHLYASYRKSHACMNCSSILISCAKCKSMRPCAVRELGSLESVSQPCKFLSLGPLDEADCVSADVRCLVGDSGAPVCTLPLASACGSVVSCFSKAAQSLALLHQLFPA